MIRFIESLKAVLFLLRNWKRIRPEVKKAVFDEMYRLQKLEVNDATNRIDKI